MKFRKIFSVALAGALLLTSTSLFGESNVADAAVISSIPNTTRTLKSYDNSFLSVTGYASLSGGVKDRSSYVGTSYYRTVKTSREFLQALLDAKSGSVKVIEIAANLNLGWKELNLSSTEIQKYNFVAKYEDPTNGYTNPTLQANGVSKINVSDTNGLTIFSTSGSTIKHAELKLQSSANDIVIRNLNFDEMWQWDDVGNHKEVGWTFIKVNGANNVWIDHCKFAIGADGMVDIENGSSGLTFSWCKFGLEANTNPASDSAIYKSITYMEQKYTSNQLASTSLYYKMRKAGATPNQIMAYSAYHSKCHLVGSGDKDYVNYVDSNGKDYKDGNQRLRITLAYNQYSNVGQRVPMIRQGVGHMINCYIDDTTHMNLENSVSAFKANSTSLARGMNARNGASIAADTCVYNGVTEPIVGTELQGQDTSNMDPQWANLFKNAYNRNLIVNSQVTNANGTYTGSSWDNNGVNLFTKGFVWYNKSTLNKWAWSSSIVGAANMSKTKPPTTPFTFQYNYTEKLPYSYNAVPLNDVVQTVKQYSGASKVTLSAKDWLKTVYSTSSTPTTGSSVNVGSYYRIKNVNSGKYLSAPTDASGTKLVQTADKTQATSLWRIVAGDTGYVNLVAQVGSASKVIDIPGASTDNGVQLQIWGGTAGADWQQFKLKDNGDGTFGILTMISGGTQGLDVNAKSTAEGASVIQYNYAASANQKWVFEFVK